jgi:hypothetical protein
MPLWTQHLLVVALVGFALFVVVRQVVGALRMKHGKIGSCCAKGCGAEQPGANDSKTASPERIVFLPLEALKSRKHN